ncbi:hypothetical protein AMJ86_01525 [bacterium SM23_57]|nr:MAG: hypothetical protein AMJ86_01525 [bacterium SM23_57]
MNYTICRQLTTMAALIWLIHCLPVNRINAETGESAQSDYSVAVDTIIIEGARVTKPFIITREMTIHSGDHITPGQLEENRNRIQNLGLFTRVEVFMRRENRRNQLVVEVTELWYIFPFPFWRKEAGDFSKITYGLQYLQKNFRGRNERISASIWMGYEEGYQLAYFNPWFAQRGTWGLAAEIFDVFRDINNEKHRELKAEIETIGGRTSVQRRFGLDPRLTATIGFTRYRTDYTELMIANDLYDDWFSLNVAFLSDRRDLYEYPAHGWFRSVNLSGSTLLNGPKSASKTVMATASLELRHYKQIFQNFILCERAIIGISSGDVPLYRRYFLGSGVRVRGWSGDTEEGEGLFLGSLELRRHIFDIRYFTWNSAPVLKRYFRNLKYGLSGALFVDLGQVWIDPGETTSKEFQAGWGLGLHIHLPYLDLLRAEAGWSPDSKFEDAKLSIRSRVAF